MQKDDEARPLKTQHIRTVSMGDEDLAIWKLMPTRKRSMFVRAALKVVLALEKPEEAISLFLNTAKQIKKERGNNE